MEGNVVHRTLWWINQSVEGVQRLSSNTHGTHSGCARSFRVRRLSLLRFKYHFDCMTLPASRDCFVFKWNFKGECILKLNNEYAVNWIAVSNHELYTLSADNWVKRWTIDGKLQQTYGGHKLLFVI